MANLTKEYFDQQFKKVAIKDDLKRLAAKEDLTQQTVELKAYTDEKVDKLAGMVARRFDELERRLDVKEEVEKLKVQMKQVRDALSL
jgi:hypothetical protein